MDLNRIKVNGKATPCSRGRFECRQGNDKTKENDSLDVKFAFLQLAMDTVSKQLGKDEIDIGDVLLKGSIRVNKDVIKVNSDEIVKILM